jgi:uncharacterized protein YbjT (DUF2867 family)
MNNPKIYAITGATSNVGQVICERLESMGHTVRKVSRASGISLDDADALTKAFEGADGVYVMIPFDKTAQDLHKREDEMGASIAEALKRTGVRRVVLLSGANAHLKNHGTSMGTGMMEDRLLAMDIPELVIARGGFFMENLTEGLGFAAQAESGVFSSAFKADRAVPMISAKDVGEAIATMLTESPFTYPKIQELLGAKDYTMAEATQILAKALGKQVQYVQATYDQARAAMLGMGAPSSFIDAVNETARSFNDDEVWAKETRSSRNTTPTTLESFAQEIVTNN